MKKMIHKQSLFEILCFCFLIMSCLNLGFITKPIKGQALVLPPPPPPPPPPPDDVLKFADERIAIVYPIIQKFKKTINSDPLGITKTWVGSDVCKYKGFFCESPPYNTSAIALASIDFNGFHLSAPTLAGFLDHLPDLALFHANSNSFSGTISPNISQLPYLYEFDISNNQFSGPFPTSILNMPTLSFLDIRFNSFTGSVPPQLFNKDLNALFINNNDFMTRLPENIASTTIFLLTLANNKFFGPIPGSIFKYMSSLREVVFLNNLLSGCLAYEVGFLREAVVLDAGNNRLTGPIPYSVGCLENLQVLNLGGNMMYGMVPEVVCMLGNMVNMTLSDNYFTMVGPICMGLIRKGVVDVRNNCIPGLPYQRSLPQCLAFISRPRFCPNLHKEMFSYIPCWLPKFHSLHLAPTPI